MSRNRSLSLLDVALRPNLRKKLFFSFFRSWNGTGRMPYFLTPLSVVNIPSLNCWSFNASFSSFFVISPGRDENIRSISGWPMTAATPAMVVGSADKPPGFWNHFEIAYAMTKTCTTRTVIITSMTQGLVLILGGQGFRF